MKNKIRKTILVVLMVFPLWGIAQPTIKITPEDALRIAIKIWYNESGGKISGLTAWNKGEDFASMGIGHFIWYPPGKRGPFVESFPKLIRYMESRGVTVPHWLQGHWVPYCPWYTRREFIRAQHSPQMIELRKFLLATIPLQAKFITMRIEKALPTMLARVPPRQRQEVRKQFYRMARTPKGIYALVDYVNFKGEGIGHYEQYGYRGWGLLQVLEEMNYAPRDLTTLEAFVWSANVVLTRRVENSPPYRNEYRWLAGWRNRLNTYL